MCKTGGPYCYRDSAKVMQNAKKRVLKNPTADNKRKFRDAVARVDSTIQGQEKLTQQISQETDPTSKQRLGKRLEIAQKTRAKQSARKREQDRKTRIQKQSSFPTGYSEEAHTIMGQVSDYKPRTYNHPEDKHVVSKWAENHDKNGKYVYRGKDHVPEVVTYDNKVYYKAGFDTQEGRKLYPSQAESFRIQVNKEMDAESAQKLGDLTRKTYGELEEYDEYSRSPSPKVIQDSPNSVIVQLHTEDNGMSSRIEQFVDNLNEDYSKSSLSGSNPKMEIYADEVEEYKDRKEWVSGQQAEEKAKMDIRDHYENELHIRELNSWYMRNN